MLGYAHNQAQEGVVVIERWGCEISVLTAFEARRLFVSYLTHWQPIEVQSARKLEALK